MEDPPESLGIVDEEDTTRVLQRSKNDVYSDTLSFKGRRVGELITPAEAWPVFLLQPEML